MLDILNSFVSFMTLLFDAGGILALIGLRIDGKQNQFHSNIDGFKRNRLDYILIINL